MQAKRISAPSTQTQKSFQKCASIHKSRSKNVQNFTFFEQRLDISIFSLYIIGIMKRDIYIKLLDWECYFYSFLRCVSGKLCGAAIAV
jgi:hypothetical protein